MFSLTPQSWAFAYTTKGTVGRFTESNQFSQTRVQIWTYVISSTFFGRFKTTLIKVNPSSTKEIDVLFRNVIGEVSIENPTTGQGKHLIYVGSRFSIFLWIDAVKYLLLWKNLRSEKPIARRTSTSLFCVKCLLSSSVRGPFQS